MAFAIFFVCSMPSRDDLSNHNSCAGRRFQKRVYTTDWIYADPPTPNTRPKNTVWRPLRTLATVLRILAELQPRPSLLLADIYDGLNVCYLAKIRDRVWKYCLIVSPYIKCHPGILGFTASPPRTSLVVQRQMPCESGD